MDVVAKTIQEYDDRVFIPVFADTDVFPAPRFVWLFARSLSWASLWSPLEWTSHGNLRFNHWGVLVTELSKTDINVVLQSSRRRLESYEDPALGTLWELERLRGEVNTVHQTYPFRLSDVRKCWRTFTALYLGPTYLSTDQIQDAGIYWIYVANVQLFALSMNIPIITSLTITVKILSSTLLNGSVLEHFVRKLSRKHLIAG
jgi:hypothetical protein